MDRLAACVADYLRQENLDTLAPDAPTWGVVRDLRAHLDAACPGGRRQALDGSGHHSLVVEFWLGERTVRAALVQRPSIPSGTSA